MYSSKSKKGLKDKKVEKKIDYWDFILFDSQVFLSKQCQHVALYASSCSVGKPSQKGTEPAPVPALNQNFCGKALREGAAVNRQQNCIYSQVAPVLGSHAKR